MYNIAVVGCGAIGLTTAFFLHELDLNVNVTIFTENVSPDTTGDVSAGLWTPFVLQNTPEKDVMRWSKLTLDYLCTLWRNGEAKELGLCLVPGVKLSTEKEYSIPEWTRIALGVHHFSSKELEMYKKIYKKDFTGGFSYITFTWEPSIFLPFFEQKFLKNGGTIIRKRITNFEELSDFDVIVNCTGLGSRELVQDKRVIPVRGQVTRVFAPWVGHMIMDDENYVIPNVNCVILGGTKQENDFDTTIREDDKKAILENCFKMVPSLQEASHIRDNAGLRPSRDEVRLELEFVKLANKELPVVHNYGHGGSGVTISYGCAVEARELVKLALRKAKL